MLFKKILDEPNRKSNKSWVDKVNEFYNKSMRSFLQNNDIETYSTHNLVISETFNRTLKNKVYKYITSISQNAYIDRLMI